MNFAEVYPRLGYMNWKEALIAHYRSAGFSDERVNAAVRRLDANSTAAEVFVPGTEIVVPAKSIPEHVRGMPPAAVDMRPVTAVFALAFGYRLRKAQPDLPEHRLPGRKNRAIALVVREVVSKFPSLVVAAQMEVADALIEGEPPVVPDVTSSVKDQGTEPVIREFIEALGWTGNEAGKTVVIAGHRHHAPRIAMLLAAKGVKALLPPVELPDGYDDPLEAQPRAKSEDPFLWSDLVSTLAFVRGCVRVAP
jgi:hypothetical protein